MPCYRRPPCPLSFLFLLSSTLVVLRTSTGASPRCIQDHHDSLLRLKHGFSFRERSKVESWVAGTDCCGWPGVTCDAESGQVTAIDISYSSINGHVDHALFNLTSLKSLNLAGNELHRQHIPSPGFERLQNLTSLNLSNTGFIGQIPSEISLLTNLVSLAISNVFYPHPLKLERPDLVTLLQNLSKLEVLHLERVNISMKGSEWCSVLFSSVPKLRVLRLIDCLLSGPIDASLSQVKSLTEIDLSANNFSSEVPPFLTNLPSLTTLRLSSCELKGSLPEFISHLPYLESLDLSNNRMLSGQLPESIGKLRSLKILKLSSCNFTGLLPASIGELLQLTWLDLSFNSLLGHIPSLYGRLQKLALLDLQSNSLNGTVPVTLFSHPSLVYLSLSNNNLSGQLDELSDISSLLETVDLRHNQLQGPVPSFIFNLSNLKSLNLASNSFSGTLDLSSFKNLGNLSDLNLSYNKLSMEITENHFSFPFMWSLGLSSCNLTKFPELDVPQFQPFFLDLSSNKIDGLIPSWIWNSTVGSLDLSNNLLTGIEFSASFLSNKYINVIDLHSNKLNEPNMLFPPLSQVIYYSYNNFNCHIPSYIGSFLNFTDSLLLSNNSLTGEIPPSICDGKYLRLLDLSYNSLTGPIPPCLGGMNKLNFLNLRGNMLSGKMPPNFNNHCSLETINLNGNMLQGSLPTTLANCKVLKVLDLGNNRIFGQFPLWFSNLTELRVLVLRNNVFNGSLSDKWNGNFEMLQIIDISLNHFSGHLPLEFFMKWKERMVLGETMASRPALGSQSFTFGNFYSQDFVTVRSKGLDVNMESMLMIFASLDFSSNSFDGIIPEEVGDLKWLYVLNMSHNNLSGPIPLSFRKLKNLESMDLSWNRLSGKIPNELADLTFLSFLNLSHNLLVGGIPSSKQFDTFSNDSFQDNLGLCGTPLSNKCGVTDREPPADSTSIISSFESGINWKLISMELGFVFGLGLVVGPLLVWVRGRRWFFGVVDMIIWRVLYRNL